MKVLTIICVLLILVLQYQLWLGEDSVRALNMLERDVADQRAINQELKQRNERLEIEVLDLKNGLEAVEERARSELGLIAEGETFYMIID